MTAAAALPPLAPLPELLAALATVPLLSLRQGPHCPILHLIKKLKWSWWLDVIPYRLNTLFKYEAKL